MASFFIGQWRDVGIVKGVRPSLISPPHHEATHFPKLKGKSTTKIFPEIPTFTTEFDSLITPPLHFSVLRSPHGSSVNTTAARWHFSLYLAGQGHEFLAGRKGRNKNSFLLFKNVKYKTQRSTERCKFLRHNVLWFYSIRENMTLTHPFVVGLVNPLQQIPF